RLQLSLVGDGLHGRALHGGAHLLGRKRGDPEIETFLREESLVPRHQYVETHEGHHALDRQCHAHGRPPLTRVSPCIAVCAEGRGLTLALGPCLVNVEATRRSIKGLRAAFGSRSSRFSETVNRADTSSKICRFVFRSKTE